MWDRAVLPFRTSPEGAATTVDNQNVFVNIKSETTGNVPLNKQKLAIYSPHATVKLNLRSGVTGAGTEAFNGHDTKLLVAKIDGKDSVTNSLSSSDTSEAMDEPMDLINGQKNTDGVTYDLKDIGSVEDGSVSTEYGLTGAGEYAFFLVSNGDDGNGFVVQDGELSVTGDAKVLGVDAAVAHQRPSHITATSETVERGDSIEFDVSDSSSEQLEHTVILYNAQTFKNSRSVLSIDEMDGSISGDKVRFERSIDEVNGVVRTDDEQKSSDMSSDEVSTDFGGLTGLVESESNAEVEDASPGTHVVLDASMTAKQSSGQTTIRVDTLENWATGHYRWTHITTDADGTIVSSETGTVAVTKASSGTPPESDNDGEDSSSGGGGGGGVSAGGSADISSSSPQSAEVKISQDREDDRYRLKFDDHTPSRNGVELNELTLQMREYIGGFSVRASIVDDIPSDVSQPPTQTAGYISIETGARESTFDEGIFRFTLSDERLDALGVSPDAVTLYRYHNGKWRALETSHIENNRFKAKTPGFSYFAIGTSTDASGAIDVTDASADTQEVSAGDTVTVSATVENTGSAKATEKIELTVDDDTVKFMNVELAPGESTTIELEHSFEDGGTYDLAVNGQSAGSVTVNAGNDDSTDATDAADESNQGTEENNEENDDNNSNTFLFIVPALLVILALGAGAFYYRDELDF